ncbi:hypothetical protein KFK09_002318 [Dendrobium nobile]|uniref:Uncharacterized protein n=1 Tax=Dendrobium nobile TaxID=94219 RepID=A0A8T3C7G5_DENNO|nr:hypothetical protein KFK09_002318 [Dendrobium nobile]
MKCPYRWRETLVIVGKKVEIVPPGVEGVEEERMRRPNGEIIDDDEKPEIRGAFCREGFVEKQKHEEKEGGEDL